MKILAAVWHFLEDLSIIYLNKSFSRVRLGYEFIKLKSKQKFHANNPNPDKIPRHIQLFGKDVAFYNYGNLLHMFREVFIYLDYYFKPSSPSPFIIDCGANIGVSLIFYKLLYPKARIIAFEPETMAFKALTANVRNNNFKDVELVNQAVSERPGKISFFVDGQDQASLLSSTVEGRLSKGVRSEAEAVLLSDYFDRRVDFLKMDIEGSEESVIAELASRGKLGLINEMVLEYHHHINPEEDRLSRMLKILEDHGFGYQITTKVSRRMFKKEFFQDILIYAYRKP